MNKALKIQAINRHRMQTDGNGVTTLIGLHGCQLNCKYCINKKLLHEYRYYDVPVDKLVDKLMIDYCYFIATGGGITLGGGEPLLQSESIIELKKKLPNNVKINIETSLNVEQHMLLDVIDFVDELIIDIKSMNPEIYKRYTCKTIDKLVNNLEYIKEKGMQAKCKIRIPNIPNYTSKEDIEQTIDIIKQLGFNNIDAFDYIIKSEK